MKKILAIMLILSTLLLVSCGSVKFEYADGKLINTKTKGAYNPLPTGFEPCGVGKAYGKFGAFELYKVQTLDGKEMAPETWVTEAYAGNATVVYLSDKEPLPAFREISFDKCYICEEDANVMSVAEIEDKALIDSVISSLDKEEKAMWPRLDIAASYSLKFHSDSLPCLFYSLVYCICDSGNYLYDRASDTCVEIGDLISEYVNIEVSE